MSLEHKDDMPLEDGYFDRINLDILKNIPIYAKKILEIGCGTGALGYKYKQSNSRCEYHGIELSEKAVDYAISQNRLDSIQIGDIEKSSLNNFGFDKESFDCIIYGDVLEHLIDPWNTIINHSEYLKQNGLIISSIPNISNFSIIYQLLKGKWTYQDEGLLDRTHLRFFTLESIKQMFSSANMAIINIEARCYNLKAHQSFMNAITPILPYLNLDLEAVKYNTQAFQYIVVAQKSKA